MVPKYLPNADCSFSMIPIDARVPNLDDENTISHSRLTCLKMGHAFGALVYPHTILDSLHLYTYVYKYA